MSASKYGCVLAVNTSTPSSSVTHHRWLGKSTILALAASGTSMYPALATRVELGHHGVGMFDVLEHVRADDVVEDLVGERHVGGVGIEQRTVDARRRGARALPAVARHRESDRAGRRHANEACRRCRHRAPTTLHRPGSRCAADETTAPAARGSCGAPMEQLAPVHPGSS